LRKKIEREERKMTRLGALFLFLGRGMEGLEVYILSTMLKREAQIEKVISLF
jgi:hypothetical protein